MRDVWEMVRSGTLVMLPVLLPIGSAGIVNLLPALACDWHPGAGTLAFVSGFGGGLVQIAGALAGGTLCDRIDHNAAFCVAGACVAAILFGMALAPRTPASFIIFSLLYLLASGSVFAAFAAVEFEAAGGGAAATKCMLLVRLSDISIDLVQLLDAAMRTMPTASLACFCWK